MDFALTEEQQAVREVFARFTHDAIEPGATERDAEGRFHYDLIAPLASTGIFGMVFPEGVGGQGASAVEYVLALEEISWSDQSVAATVANQVGLAALPIFTFGTEAQKDRWLPSLFSGTTLGAFALTEPGGGSDNRSLATTATAVSDGWVLNGSKTFITNAGTDLTGLIIVAARTGTSETGSPLIGAFLVASGSPGLSVGPPLRKLGWRSSDTRAVYLDDVVVDRDAVLGDPSRGLRALLRTLEFGRIQIATLGVGLARRALDEAKRYALEREAFGRPIGAFQGVSFKISDMATGVRVSRLLTLEAAWRHGAGLDYGIHASHAKLCASEVAVAAAHSCSQIMGAYGFMDDGVAGRLYRDAKVLEVGEGTSEIQRVIISRDELGGLR